VFWEWISTFEFLDKVSEVPISSFFLSFRWVFLVFGASLQGVGRWAMVGRWVGVLWLVRPVDGGLIRIRHSPQGNNRR